jgi:hypothetical protein
MSRFSAAHAALVGGTPGSPRARLALACLAACSAVGGVVPASGARADSAAIELLDRAREAAQTHPFEGVVAVEWHDGQRPHSAQVRVRNAGGVLRFGDEVVGTGARRMVHGADGWLSLWGHDVATLGPSPTGKYHLRVEPGPDVAARPTDMLVVQVAGAGRPRERLYVDRENGLVLRRELLDSHGNPYRSVAFTTITSGSTTVEAAAVSTPPQASRSREPAPARHLKAPFKLKSAIGSGYRRVGAYKVDGVVQQFYSDGLHGLSVFEQRGHLKGPGRNPAGGTGSGRQVEIAGHTMRAYSASVGEAVVWEADGVVYTVLTDAPWSDLVAAVRDLPHADPPGGRLRRVAEAIVTLFRWK